MALFALDQNFPEPILQALNDFIPEAELVPLQEIDPLLAEIDDWQVLLEDVPVAVEFRVGGPGVIVRSLRR